MQDSARDAALLLDMLQAARTVLRFTQSRTREEYSNNDMLRAAVERAVEIVGEASRHISKSFTTQHPEIEWRRIRATRHILAHDYGKIDDDVMWRIAIEHIPKLIDLLTPLVTPPPP